MQKCGICGYEAHLAHAFTYTSEDDARHSASCALCGSTYLQAHSWSSGACSACALEAVTLRIEADGTASALVRSLPDAEAGTVTLKLLDGTAAQVTLLEQALRTLPEDAAPLRVETALGTVRLTRDALDALRTQPGCILRLEQTEPEPGAVRVVLTLTDAAGNALTLPDGTAELIVSVPENDPETERWLFFTVQGAQKTSLPLAPADGKITLSVTGSGVWERLRLECRIADGIVTLTCAGLPRNVLVLLAGTENGGRLTFAQTPQAVDGETFRAGLPEGQTRCRVYVLRGDLTPLCEPF